MIISSIVFFYPHLYHWFKFWCFVIDTRKLKFQLGYVATSRFFVFSRIFVRKPLGQIIRFQVLGPTSANIYLFKVKDRNNRKRCQSYQEKHQNNVMTFLCCLYRGGSRTAATCKIERFVIIVNGYEPLTIITKSSILDVAAVLDPSLFNVNFEHISHLFRPWVGKHLLGPCRNSLA